MENFYELEIDNDERFISVLSALFGLVRIGGDGRGLNLLQVKIPTPSILFDQSPPIPLGRGLIEQGLHSFRVITRGWGLELTLIIC